MVTLIITIAAVWLAQRLLAVRQAMQFRAQFAALRTDGRDVAVGMAKRFGRRVYVALAADRDGRLAEAVVLRGVTVWAKGKDAPALTGCAVRDLVDGRYPAGLPPMVTEAAGQAAGFLATAMRKRTGRTPAKRVDRAGAGTKTAD